MAGTTTEGGALLGPREPTELVASAPPSAEPEAAFAEATLSAAEVRNRAASGAVLYALRGMAVRAIGLGVQLLFARLLGPDEFGQIGVGLTVIALASVVADVGLGVGLIRRPEPPTVAELRSLTGLHLCGSMTVVLLAVGLAGLLSSSGWATAVMICALPVMAFRLPGFVKLERSLRFGAVASVEVFETAVAAAFALVGALLGWGVWALAVSYAIRMIAGTVLTLVLARQRPVAPALDLPAVRPLIGFGLQVQLENIFTFGGDFALWALAIGLSTDTAWGLYALANQIVKAPLLLVDSIWRVSLPAMSRLIEHKEDVGPIVARSLSIATFVLACVIVPLTVAAPGLVVPVFGDSYDGAGYVLAWCCVALFVSAGVYVATVGYLLAVGDSKSVLRASIIEVSLNLVLAAVLLPRYGAMALALGWMAAGVVHAVLLLEAAARQLAAANGKTKRAAFVDMTSGAVIPMFAALAIMFAGMLLWWMVDSTFLTAVASGMVAALVYLAAIALLSPSTVRSMLSLVLGVLRRARGIQPSTAH